MNYQMRSIRKIKIKINEPVGAHCPQSICRKYCVRPELRFCFSSKNRIFSAAAKIHHVRLLFHSRCQTNCAQPNSIISAKICGTFCSSFIQFTPAISQKTAWSSLVFEFISNAECTLTIYSCSTMSVDE